MSRDSLKTIAEKDQWVWEDHCRAHAYNTGEDLLQDPEFIITPVQTEHVPQPRDVNFVITEIITTFVVQEKEMSMEKRGVVENEAEKTAQKKTKEDAQKGKKQQDEKSKEKE